MKKIDWNSLVPLGMDGKTIRNRMLTVLSISAVWSLQFIWKCGMEVNGLYYINWTERVLQPGAQMRWFSELVDGAFVLFGLTALSMLIIAVILRKFLINKPLKIRAIPFAVVSIILFVLEIFKQVLSFKVGKKS